MEFFINNHGAAKMVINFDYISKFKSVSRELINIIWCGFLFWIASNSFILYNKHTPSYLTLTLSPLVATFVVC